jgi:uncharacterized GH25 family protein
MRIFKYATVTATSLFVLASVFAHDTWIMPDKFYVRPGENLIVDLTSGMEFPKVDVGPKHARIQAVICRLNGNTSELTDFAEAPTSLRIKAALAQTGIATLWVKTPAKGIELKPDQVQEYLDEIDAPASVRRQWAVAKEPKRWRESYCKHSKTFVRVGDATADTSWREPVSMFLEIIPEKDPTTLRVDEDFPVRVLKNGKPFADFSLAIVGGGNAKGAIQKTDEGGRATFRLDKAGPWLLRGTDLRRSIKQDVDWESDFTTLTIHVGQR